MRTEARREAILGTAAEAFMELGYEGTSMAEIAARADCSKATLYGYFASKEELFLGVVDFGFSAEVDPLLDELAAGARDDPSTVLKRFGERTMTLSLAPRSIAMRRLIIAQMGDPELVQRYWHLGPGRYLNAMESYLKAATEAARLTVSDPKLASQQLAALYEAETRSSGLFAGGRAFTPSTIKQLVSRAVEAFLRIYAA